MTQQTTCRHCGKAVSDELLGLCPDCMLKAGLATQTGGEASRLDDERRFVPPSPEELAGRFPQLEIVELLGRGGMGAVYKARQKQLDRVVALKILPARAGAGPAFAERFAREAKALAALGHPNIVTLYEFGQADGLYYFLMEFVDGMNLRRLLDAGKLAPREALAIVPQICEALQYAHDRGIVHRDIKPENILLGRDGVVKIADFGVAKIVGRGEARVQGSGFEAQEPAHEGAAAVEGITVGGGVVGTPLYMAPEQVDRPTEVDHRADIYSLGVVFYQMLTGELPGRKIEPPSRKVRIDVRLDEVVLRALEKEPERRYSQASVMKTEVETIAADSRPAASSHREVSPYATPERPPRPAWHRLVAVVGTVEGRPVINWAGVVFDLLAGIPLFVLSWAVTSAVKGEWPSPVLLPLWMALVAVPLTIVIGILWGFTKMPPDRLVPLDARPAGKGGHSPRPSTWEPRPHLWAGRGEGDDRSPPPNLTSAGASPAPGATDADDAHQQVRGPAIGLLITGIANWVGIPLLTFAIVIALPYLSQQFPNARMVMMPAAVLIPIAAMIFASIMIYAAIRMRRLEAYSAAVTASILATVITPGNLIGLPVGIWSLIVLSRPNVRKAFAKQRDKQARDDMTRGGPPGRWQDKFFWQRGPIAAGLLWATVLIVATLMLRPHLNQAIAILVLFIASQIICVSVLYGWVGRKIRQMKSAMSASDAEIADAWLTWSDGLWPFNGSQGLAVLHADRMDLHPAWYGTTITVPLADIASVREVGWVWFPLFWKRGFALTLSDGRRVNLAVADPVGRRWRARLSRGRLPELPGAREPEPIRSRTASSSSPADRSPREGTHVRTESGLKPFRREMHAHRAIPLVSIVRWLARVAGTAILLLFGLIIMGEATPPVPRQPVNVQIEFVGMLLWLIGFIVGWRRDGWAAFLLIIGTLIFHVVEGRWLMDWAFEVPAIIGLLYAWCWWMSRPASPPQRRGRLIATVLGLPFIAATALFVWLQWPQPLGDSVWADSPDGMYFAAAETRHAMRVFGRDRLTYRFTVRGRGGHFRRQWEIPIPTAKLATSYLAVSHEDCRFDSHGSIDWSQDSRHVSFRVRGTEVAALEVGDGEENGPIEQRLRGLGLDWNTYTTELAPDSAQVIWRFSGLREMKGVEGRNVWTPIDGNLIVDLVAGDVRVRGDGQLGHVQFAIPNPARRSAYPKGTYVTGHDACVYLVHDDVDVHYVLFHAGDFSASSGSSHNTHSLAWIDKGALKLRNGRTFGFLREAVHPFHLTINGQEFDLRHGRVIVLHEDGSAEQLKLYPPLAAGYDPSLLAGAVSEARAMAAAPADMAKLKYQLDVARSHLADLLKTHASTHSLVVETRQTIRALEQEMQRQQGSATPASRLAPASWPALSAAFGPVIERVVNDQRALGGDHCIDLDTGRLFTLPEPRKTDFPWLLNNGIDAICVRDGTATQGLMAIGGTVAHEVDNTRWDMIQATEIMSETLWQKADFGTSIALVNQDAVIGGPSLPVTFIFRTRDGGMGILQVLSFTEAPRGVKIRYKLVQKYQPATMPVGEGGEP